MQISIEGLKTAKEIISKAYKIDDGLVHYGKQQEDTTFRGKPIKWITEECYKPKLTENAFDDLAKQENVFAGYRHLIDFNG